MRMVAAPLGQPALHRVMLVRGVVVQLQIDVQMCRHIFVDQPQEREELLAPVPRLALGDPLAGGDVQGREQSRRAVAQVVVRALSLPRRRDPWGVSAGSGRGLGSAISHRARASSRDPADSGKAL